MRIPCTTDRPVECSAAHMYFAKKVKYMWMDAVKRPSEIEKELGSNKVERAQITKGGFTCLARALFRGPFRRACLCAFASQNVTRKSDPLTL